MKKLVLALWISLYPFFLLAQNSTVHPLQNEQNNPLTTHELLYQSRTSTIPPTLKISPTFLQEAHEETFIFDPDTNWSYDEFKWQGFDTYAPGNFSQYFDLGSETEFARHGDLFNWESDTTGWILGRRNITWVKDAFKDSTKNIDVDENGDITYGSFYVYSRTPAMGATEESFYHRFDPIEGWVKDSRSLQYSNEDESITWRKNYRYDADSAEYLINHEAMTEDLETHYLYEYKSYAGGLISYWDKRFSLYNPDGTTAYSLRYNYNSTFKTLDPFDSTAFVYHDDFAEAFGYRWYRDFQEWEFDSYTATYESESAQSSSGMRVDSIVTREVYYDTELDSIVTGIILSKTDYIYDANGNMIELINYQQGSNGLEIFSRYVNEFELIDGEYRNVAGQNYNYSYSLMGLYLAGEWQYIVDPDLGIIGDMNLFFSESGDTTGGFKMLMYTEGETNYLFNFDWDMMENEFYVSGLMVENWAEPVSYFSYISSEWGSDRSMHVMDGLPAAMSPSPLFLAIDDTVDIVINAFNPDISTPAVSMSDIPATATFDPETRRFYWIVDEVVDGPFQITATQGMKSTTTEVKVVFDEFTVGSETEDDVPGEITLYQNYPNPFNPTTTIGFELPLAQLVHLQVFNILGQPVQTLVQGELLSAGIQEVQFNAQNLSSGVYYYRLEVGDKVYTKKMTLVK